MFHCKITMKQDKFRKKEKPIRYHLTNKFVQKDFRVLEQ
ncbi:unnamed protein product [Paramecium sonneborni]|uniref:Uncharacterized protein n=1 Tax=Paramecium sonneborni TaxID=65129 RepID=A0A8S1LX56_9CILI|nr:unnamed protein product [Paramecium sonneborni]